MGYHSLEMFVRSGGVGEGVEGGGGWGFKGVGLMLGLGGGSHVVRSMVKWRRGVEGYDTRLAFYGEAWCSAART